MIDLDPELRYVAQRVVALVLGAQSDGLRATRHCRGCRRNAILQHRFWRLWSGRCGCGRLVTWFTPLGFRKRTAR